LPLRRTLVAPGFFEPYVRGSGNLKIQLDITAKEIDPSKYANTANTHNVM
jgi:hypothetical protein